MKEKEEEEEDSVDSSVMTSTSNSTTKKGDSETTSEEDEEEDEEEEEEDDEEEEEEEEEIDGRAKLRRRSVDALAEFRREQQSLKQQISAILKRDGGRTKEEENLLQLHPEVVEEVLKRASKRETQKNRKEEIEDSKDVLDRKCVRLAEAIRKSKYLVCYTGAGISTAANIPDYRGPNGVWTLLDKGDRIAECNLEQSKPTLTHMALFNLYKKGKLKHIVSQNCDGLHMRSGIPRYSLSELHGNMFIEICKHCKPMRPFLRLFDVTERTNKNRHTTNRRCYVCGNSLYDTIVHFGERGSIKWPINWDGASKAAEKADVILCLGSSLKVLRRYPWLWCMDRPKKLRPKLYIVNLQWTPKDSAATLKLNGKCDDVLKRVSEHLNYEIPEYCAKNDPLLSFATRLHSREQHTTTKRSLLDVLIKTEDEKKLDTIGEEQKAGVINDHNYATQEASNGGSNGKSNGNSSSSSSSSTKKRGKKKNGAHGSGQLMKSSLIDYKSIIWPRDALYLPYECKFEYLDDCESKDNIGYVCDCCDPAKRRKRGQGSDSGSEEADDATAVDDNDETTTESNGGGSSCGGGEIKVEIKEESSSNDSPKYTSNPGWFGKGRRKRNKQ